MTSAGGPVDQVAVVAANRRTADARALVRWRHHVLPGMAPDARIVSVKVGDSTGKSDVSQVIAAIAWVVAHKGFTD